MIDHKNHHARYCELMRLASASSPARQQDGGYMAALYILSADPVLCNLAGRKIGPDGISFSTIFSTARRLDLSDSQHAALRAAHSLFNSGSRSQNTPHDLAQCDYETLDIIVNAMYIWKGGCIITPGDTGAVCLDRSEEYKRRSFEQSMFSTLFASAD
jgi:hypothetical protein